MGQLLLKMLVGAIAGLAIWMLFEPSAPPLASDAWQIWEAWLFIMLGATVGACVGALNGWIQGSKVHLLRGAGFGLVFGAFGGALGHALGGALYSAVFRADVFISPDYSVPARMVARMLALAPAGALLGVAIGGSSLNKARMVQGLIGGVLGGAIAGILFDPLGMIVGPLFATMKATHGGQLQETGALSRALTCVLLGGLICLFIGIVDLIARSAWVRLVLGRNEGKEWPIDSPQTFIGRKEGANIPLFGDQNIAPMHACITKQGGSYTISDGGSPIGTYVNGQRISTAPLFHGAQIQIGSFTLQFLMKKGSAPVRGPENFNQAYAIQNQGAQVGAAPYVAAQGYPQPGYPQQGYPTQAMPAAGPGYGQAPTQAMPAPGSLYGAAPTQAMPAPSGGFPAQQPTIAYPSPASQPTMAYGAAAGGFTLSAIDGPLVGQRFPVRAPIELGRESASVPMSFDTGASRRHAGITPGPMGLVVTDLNSTNGTFVNGQRVQSANAGPGDLIKVGATTFRVEPG